MGMTLLRILPMGLATFVSRHNRVPHVLVHQILWQNARRSQGSGLVFLFFVAHHIQFVNDLCIFAILAQIIFILLIFNYLFKFISLIKVWIHRNVKSVPLLCFDIFCLYLGLKLAKNLHRRNWLLLDQRVLALFHNFEVGFLISEDLRI